MKLKSLSLGCMAAMLLCCTIIFSSNAQKSCYFYPLKSYYAQIKNRKLRLMPTGDSNTAGTLGNQSYRYYLWKSLEKAGYANRIDFVGTRHGIWEENYLPADTMFDMDHEGHPGFSCFLLSRNMSMYLQTLSGRNPSELPDVVFIHIGTNDVATGVPLSNSRNSLIDLIDTIRAYNPLAVVLLAQIIPSFYSGTRLDAYNEMIAAVVAQKSTLFSPVILVDQREGFDIRSDLEDGVHLNSSGEQKVAARFFEPLVSVINSMIGKPCEIFPGSGTFPIRERLNVSIVQRVNSPVSSYELKINDNKIYGPFSVTSIAGGEGYVYRLLKPYSGFDIGAGDHTLTLQMILSNGVVLTDTVRWSIIPTSMP